MEVEINLEPGRSEPKVIILTGEITAAVADLARRLTAGELRFLPGWQDGEVFLLDPKQIRRIWAEGQAVLARTESAALPLKLRLYELEDRLSGSSFLRVSHGEIVNFDHVKSLDFSMAGTLSLRLDNGDAVFVSRRYMAKIKSYLGI
jgi:DNA-binding LytR/AlgR family response regulator